VREKSSAQEVVVETTETFRQTLRGAMRFGLPRGWFLQNHGVSAQDRLNDVERVMDSCLSFTATCLLKYVEEQSDIERLAATIDHLGNNVSEEDLS